MESEDPPGQHSSVGLHAKASGEACRALCASLHVQGHTLLITRTCNVNGGRDERGDGDKGRQGLEDKDRGR